MPDHPPQPRLTKRHVEILMESYDSDPVASLTQALTQIVGAFSSWDELVEALPVQRQVQERLRAHDTSAMDDLVKQLVEFRSLEK